jgi:hypothetical protein
VSVWSQGSTLITECGLAVKDMDADKSDYGAGAAHCIGMIEATSNGMEFSERLELPHAATLQQLVRVVHFYLVNHPEKLNAPAFALIQEALTNSFGKK